MRQAAVVLTALALLLVIAREAEACQQDVCAEIAELALTPQGTLPQNTPAIVVLKEGDVSDGSVFLRDSSGGDVELDFYEYGDSKTLVVQPRAPLEPSAAYELQLATACPMGLKARGKSRPFTLPFKTNESQSLPIRAANLHTEYEGLAAYLLFSHYSCTERLTGPVARFRIEPLPEALPFLPLIRWELRVDGRLWATELAGAVDAAGALHSAVTYENDEAPKIRRIKEVWSDCVETGGFNRSSQGGLAEGTHHAELRAELLGHGYLQSAYATFKLECEERPEEQGGCAAAGPDSLALFLAAVGFLRRRRRV